MHEQLLNTTVDTTIQSIVSIQFLSEYLHKSRIDEKTKINPTEKVGKNSKKKTATVSVQITHNSKQLGIKLSLNRLSKVATYSGKVISPRPDDCFRGGNTGKLSIEYPTAALAGCCVAPKAHIIIDPGSRLPIVPSRGVIFLANRHNCGEKFNLDALGSSRSGEGIPSEPLRLEWSGKRLFDPSFLVVLLRETIGIRRVKKFDSSLSLVAGRRRCILGLGTSSSSSGAERTYQRHVHVIRFSRWIFSSSGSKSRSV